MTQAEIALAKSIFGNAIDYTSVRLHNRKWAFFQPRNTVMAPDGHVWFHPKGDAYCDDFCTGPVDAQGLFLHEMTHVWQRQKGIYLPLRRHPFCRYGYIIRPGQPFEKYGLEQQAELVRHAFLIRERRAVPGAPPLSQIRSILPFDPI